MAISGTYSANDAVSFKDCLVEVDLTPGSSSYADIDSWATEVSVSGEDVPTTEVYPFEGSAIVFAGNKSPVEVQVTAVYTEGSTDPFKNIRDYFEANDGPDFDVRFAPAGSSDGNYMFTTSGGKLIACPPPQGAGDAASAQVFTFVVRADSLARTAMS
jgi:hypothetical protein